MNNKHIRIGSNVIVTTVSRVSESNHNQQEYILADEKEVTPTQKELSGYIASYDATLG